MGRTFFHSAGRALAAALLSFVVGFTVFGAGSAAGGQPARQADALTAVSPPSGFPADAREVAQLRTRTSRTYARSDGSYEALISPGPINYRDASHDWQPIDNTLVSSPSGGYENAANSFKTYLPADARGEVKVANEGEWLSFALAGASGGGSVSGAGVTYRDALPGVSVSYQAENDALKETLSLARSSAPSSFSYALKTSSGLTPRKNGSGGVDLLDASGKPQLRLAAPVMEDAAGRSSTSFTLALAAAPGGYTLTLGADPAWLASPARAWPVKIDPTTIGAVNDCTLKSASPSTSFCGASRLYVGWDGSQKSRAVLTYDLSSIPTDSNVIGANIQANLIQQSTTNPTSISLYRLTRSYTGAVTWNTYNGSNAWTSPGGDFDPTPVSTTTNIGAGQPAGVDLAPTIPFNWFLTNLARGWVYGTIPNNGVLLKQTSESTVNVQQFERRGDVYPLSVTYRLRVGVRDEYTYDSQSLNDRMGIHVNVANGNVVLAADDLNIAGGAAPDLSLERFYNTGMIYAGMGGVFGNAWSLGPADIRLLIPGGASGMSDPNTVTFQDGDMSTYLFSRNQDGTYASPPAIDASLVKNGDNSYTLTFNASGLQYNFESTFLRLSSIKDRNGNTISLSYNQIGGSIAWINTPRTNVSFTYGANGRVSSISDGSGRQWQYGYDAQDELTSYTDPAGKVTTYGYLAPGSNLLTKITDPLGNVTTIGYDTFDRVTSIARQKNTSESSGPTTTFTYNSGNTVVTDPNGHATTYFYDSSSRVTKVTDALGHSNQVTYNANSDVTQETNATNAVTTYSYDANNNPTTSQLPTGATDRLDYLDSGHKYSATKQTDAQGNTWHYSYDTPGNLIQKSEGEAGQNPLKFTYNANGTLKSALDAKGTQTAACPVDPTLGVRPTYCYSYDNHGDLTQITNPAPLGAETFTYNFGRVATATDGAGHRATYTYDNLDRVTGISYLDGSSISYVYDANGNQTSMTDSTGTTTNTYDQRNQLTQESLPGPKTNTYGYDPAGNLTVFTDAGGTVIYGYDAADRLTSLKEPNQSVTSFGYDANDDRTSTSYPNGVTQSYGYDASERLSSIGASKGASTLTSFSYSYNQGGSDRELRQSVTDNLAGQTTSYSYDTLERLTRANSQSANYQYAYDVNGNMCAKNTGAFISGFNCSSSGSGVTTFTYNTANELSGSGYAFDGAGNETASPSFSSLTYNGKNQTASITPSGGSAVPMTYTGIGQALRTAAGGTSYVNSALGLSAETTGSNTTYYTRAPNGGLTEERLPGGNYYYLYDGLGSVVALTDSTGAVSNTYKYEPYGAVSSSTGSVANPWRFAGYYFDASTGLYKVGERYYGPGTGRWLQRDVIDTPLDAHGWNRYIYAGDDPINEYDPSGLIEEETQGGAGGGGEGAGGGGPAGVGGGVSWGDILSAESKLLQGEFERTGLGVRRLRNSIRSLRARVVEHERAIAKITGSPEAVARSSSSMMREIRAFKRQIRAAYYVLHKYR